MNDNDRIQIELNELNAFTEYVTMAAKALSPNEPTYGLPITFRSEAGYSLSAPPFCAYFNGRRSKPMPSQLAAAKALLIDIQAELETRAAEFKRVLEVLKLALEPEPVVTIRSTP